MSPVRMEKSEAAVRIVLEFNAAYNRQDVAGLAHCLSPECILENTGPAPDGAVYRGKEALTRYYQEVFSRSSRLRIEVEEIFGFGYRCVMRWKASWVESGGIERHVRGVDLYQVKDGLIHETLSYVKG